MKEVQKAATLAGFDASVLPKGFDTELGFKGAPKLDKRQLQRIGLARALCRKPALLLLDESTAALDPETEEDILSRIKSLHKDHPAEFGSLIVISTTHKTDTLKHASMVIHLGRGRISHISNSVDDISTQDNVL